MEFDLEVCPKHYRLITDDSLVCIDCLKEKNFSVKDDDDGLFINIRHLKELVQNHFEYEKMEQELYWSSDLIKQIINYLREIQTCQADELNIGDTEEEKELINNSFQMLSDDLEQYIIDAIQERMEERKK